jgi:hypothetical protein
MRQTHPSTAQLLFVGDARAVSNGALSNRHLETAMTRHPTHEPREHFFDLGTGELLVYDHSPGLRLQVLSGGLWLTEEGSMHDRFGAVGEWLRIECGGRAVAEALAPTRVSVTEPAPGARWRATWARWQPRGLLAIARSPTFALALLLGVGLPEMLARAFQQSALG